MTMIVAGIEMLIKNTFLEVVEAKEVEGPRLRRCKTDPAVIAACSRPGSDEPPESDAESDASVSGASSSASTASTAQASRPETPRASAAKRRTLPRAPGGRAVRPGEGGAVDGAAVAGMDAEEVSAAPGALGAQAATGGATGAPRGPALRCDGASPHGGHSAAPSHAKGACRAASDTEGGARQRRDHDTRTTVMLRNLPNDYTRCMLLELLDEHGFSSRYDFAYVPTDFARQAGLGYAFVNMCSPADAQAVRRALEGFRRWSLPSAKVCSVGWSVDQGLEANLTRYRDSPVMHPSVPETFKPVLLREGVSVPFPGPTRPLRRPNWRRSGR